VISSSPAELREGAGFPPREQGAVLVEVLLALALFVAAAAVATTALNASLQSLERQKQSSQALNLAASVLAEVQLGIRPASADNPQPLEPPFQDWTWQLVLTPTETATGEATGLTRVEVVIRRLNSRTVQRLAEAVRLNSGLAATNATAASLM
jgi:type II secretory pathway pseudopilin PulG